VGAEEEGADGDLRWTVLGPPLLNVLHVEKGRLSAEIWLQRVHRTRNMLAVYCLSMAAKLPTRRRSTVTNCRILDIQLLPFAGPNEIPRRFVYFFGVFGVFEARYVRIVKRQSSRVENVGTLVDVIPIAQSDRLQRILRYHMACVYYNDDDPRSLDQMPFHIVNTIHSSPPLSSPCHQVLNISVTGLRIQNFQDWFRRRVLWRSSLLVIIRTCLCI